MCQAFYTFPTGAKHAVNGRALALEGKCEPPDGGSNDIPYRWAHQRFLQQTMVTGEAAGTAAALCVKKGITPRQLEDQVGELQDVLRKNGVILDGVH